jgi:nitroreductase/FMN reductase (NADPH)/FMN reductase [NAD(P)H]
MEAFIMTNPILESLKSRKSVRVYEDRAISGEMKEAILQAAAEAPTAGCQQLYTILDITDQALKDALSVTCDHQPFIARAPMVLVFCADCKKWYDAFVDAGCDPREPGVGDLMLAVTDTAIAAQNAVVAAESFGIGSCYIGDIMENCEEQRKLLHLPPYVFPAVMLVFGWPTVQQLEREKPQRCSLKHIVHENTYRSMDKTELDEMFAYKAKSQTYEQWCKAFCNRKYNSDFAKEMTRSVAQYLKDFTD